MNFDEVYTKEEFFVDLAEYYGMLPEGIMKRVSEWITAHDLKGHTLRSIYLKLTESFRPYSYKQKPDLYDIVDAWKTANIAATFSPSIDDTDTMVVLAQMRRLDDIILSTPFGWNTLPDKDKEAYYQYYDLLHIYDLGKESGFNDTELMVVIETAKELIRKSKSVSHLFSMVAKRTPIDPSILEVSRK